MRTNTYDAATGTITLPDDRALALSNVAAHYESLFGNDPATATLREAYAMKNDTVPDAEHRRALTAFFWWTAWAAGTERPLEPGDAMVPEDRRGRQAGHLHQQLAVASRSSTTRRRRRCGCGRPSACCS
jgi:nitric oxide reductase large subunit